MKRNNSPEAALEHLRVQYFEALKGGEQRVQTFLENHTEMFPLPFYIGHRIQWNSIISKFPLSTSIITDFVYVTRTSNRFQIVLVELEKPSKKIFTRGINAPKSAKFSEAEAQILSWRDFVENNRPAVLNSLSMMTTHGHWHGVVEFRYVLIYGRSTELEGREDRTNRFERFSDGPFHYMTYDSVWTRFLSNYEPRERHVLRLSKDRLTFKRLGVQDVNIFAYLGPDRFVLSTQHRKELIARGYEIDAWEKGKKLGHQFKYVIRPGNFRTPPLEETAKAPKPKAATKKARRR